MKEYKGITLIALIITVIVMLILAGVALSAISGETGLFSKAQETAELYNSSVHTQDTTINKIIDRINDEYNNANGGEYGKIYGIKRDINNESSKWERIEDSVGLNANATHNGGEVVNDFDNIYPWSAIKTCDLSADGTVNKYYNEDGFSYENPEGYIMTEFPEFWWKREQKGGYEYIYISDSQHEDFTKSEKFYLGRYTAGGTQNAITTKSGVENLVNITLPDFRTAAQKIGKDWGQLDIMRWSMLQMLYLVEYADYNSQKNLGYGNVNSESVLNTGQCDNLGMKSGCITNDTKSAVIYRGIENIFGNITQWCDGMNFKDRQAYICTDRTKYESDKFDDTYTKLGYVCPPSNNTWPYFYYKQMGYDESNPAIQIPFANGGTATTYMTDICNTSATSASCTNVGGSCLASTDGGGLFYYRLELSSSYSYYTVDGRLLYIPS